MAVVSFASDGKDRVRTGGGAPRALGGEGRGSQGLARRMIAGSMA